MRVTSPFLPRSNAEHIDLRGGIDSGTQRGISDEGVRFLPPTPASAFSHAHGLHSSFSPPLLRPSLQSQQGTDLYAVLAATTGCSPIVKSARIQDKHQSPPCTFVPVLTRSEDAADSSLGALSPYNKASPTPSVLTATTMDSIESVGFSPASPAGIASRNYSTTPFTPPSSFQPVWSPSQDVSLCKFIERPNSSASNSSNYTRRSPASFDGSQSPSPIKKKQLFRSNNSDDPMRLSRRKTELCMHYVNKTQCPFGSSCTYAHGEEELQLRKLMDLHRAGMADCATYRIKPCLTWVSTGSCPFGKRCAAIHDPRLAGSEQSWLPHTETQGNTLATDCNVDALHQKRLDTIHYDNPFGALYNEGEKDTFEDLYALVCNTKRAIVGPNHKAKRRVPALTEQHKLSIALQMRGESDFQFKFKPQHFIFDELCMVLQKRAFRLTREGGACEIPLTMYNARSSKNVLVREIAFGPDAEPTIRGVGLWFNIFEKDVSVCTPQQAKRYRWKRPAQKKVTESSHFRTNTSQFDARESFTMIRPMDPEAFDICTAMLAHRLDFLKAEKTANLRERNEALESLRQEKRFLESSFKVLMQHWKNWSWPINKGREAVNESTPVPLVDSEYSAARGPAVIREIWESFTETDFQPNRKNGKTTIAPPRGPRLHVMKLLAAGFAPVLNDGKLPHISKPPTPTEIGTGPMALQSSRCWKSLLLKPTNIQEHNEWEIVRNHFQHARSRKVLSILQQ